MILPNYWLPRPEMNLDDDEVRAAFDGLLALIKIAGNNTLIQYTLPYPKWQFLCYLAENHGLAMHGTGDADIRIFEPRKADDLNDFGNQKAVYAAGDGLWAMFFAIVDRQHYPMSISNACIRLVDAAGQVSEPRYVFSVSQGTLRQRPWRTGWVYILPPETFAVQPPIPFGPYEVHIPQLASPVPVTPLARLEIAPDDFPFLENIRGHADARLHEYAQAMQTGAPWPDPPEEG